MTSAIWWARRDLRLADNQALHEATRIAETVIPAFILDPALLAAYAGSEKRIAFLFGGLAALDASLRARGSRLIVRRGDPAVELARLVRETGAVAVCAEEDVWPYARRRDAAVAAAVALRLTPGLTVHPVDLVRKADGSPYTVFTPYSRAWKSLPPPDPEGLLPAPARLPAPPAELAGLPVPPTLPVPPALPALPPGVPFPPGEAEAARRLAAFIHPPSSAVRRYAAERDRMDLDGTSRLSPYLRFGMISARQCAAAATAAAATASAATAAAAGSDGAVGRGAATWLNELIWREFYMAILHHFPHVLEEAFRPELREIPWENHPAHFDAWCQGRTGYPVVDAAMRQLVQTGWMHNRPRMITASFLAKDLLIDWRWGERFFMEHLVDGDPAANNGGWQWTAGVGVDAAPYFRVFNPTLQAARFDPDGAYVRRWLPELARVPAEHIHEPWRMPDEVQRRAGCIIGQHYPAPIVDHAAARARVLAAYKTR